VGVDVVHVPRFAARLAETPRLAEALFTPAERSAAGRRSDPTQGLALHFAAKEALLKALGRGLVPTGPDAALQEIEVVLDEGGPRLRLTGRIASAVLNRAGGPPLLALAKAGGHALATVLLMPGGAARASATRKEATA
jgi:holo-[acyl-carrier protein] synthase